MGYWNGAVEEPTIYPPSDFARLNRLQPDARNAVLHHEAMSLFKVTPDADGYTVFAGDPQITLIPPSTAKIAEQMAEVRNAMDLRADRLPEIIAQQGDMLSFFGAQQVLNNNRRRSTMLLLSMLYEAVASQEMRMKHFCSVLRPIDLSPQVQPVIHTPGHSAYPSGHATEAFAFATCIAALRLAGDPKTAGTNVIGALKAKLISAMDAASQMDPDILLFRLAARIADNRTVAGVHYPVDSAHGGLLGYSTTLAFVAHCLGGGTAHPVPAFKANGNDWQGDFTLSKWCSALGKEPGFGWTVGENNLPKVETWHLLPHLWDAAVAEWTPGEKPKETP